ncbi:hypothetical protein NQ318_019247 [Aromia moschata]|uniref:Uncharacterized protein n=1 Tax=Aromia moschata TaxID=1265417 RepID=A0AAV8Z0G5_9CUCU|nr:hypothetical protein NQ318_019247 [Aromia moschata]
MNSVDFLLTNKDITYEIRTEIKRVLRKVDIRQQLDSAYPENIRRHNENVDKNRPILNQILISSTNNVTVSVQSSGRIFPTDKKSR